MLRIYAIYGLWLSVRYCHNINRPIVWTTKKSLVCPLETLVLRVKREHQRYAMAGGWSPVPHAKRCPPSDLCCARLLQTFVLVFAAAAYLLHRLSNLLPFARYLRQLSEIGPTLSHMLLASIALVCVKASPLSPTLYPCQSKVGEPGGRG